MATTTLLGPQRFLITAGAVVRDLTARGVDGPVATVNAGWQEREDDDGELQEVMGGRARNLRLHARLMSLLDEDPDVATEALRLRTAVDELSALYSTRLRPALDALYAVQRATARSDVREAAVADAVRALRDLDAWYLDAVDQLHGELRATGVLERSDALGRHRREVADLLAECPVLALAGGHVGVLGRVLRLFAVRPDPGTHVVAWSGGAMVVTERVVLFHDDAPAALPGAEVWDRGLGRVRGVVALPHARRRLRLDDAVRLSLLARRFADARCLLLDEGAKVVLEPDGGLPPGARVLTSAGQVALVEKVPV